MAHIDRTARAASSYFRFVTLSVAACALCFTGGCGFWPGGASGQGSEAAGRGWESETGSVGSADGVFRVAGIPTEMLTKAGLEGYWFYRIPLGGGVGVAELFFHRGRVYVIDSANVLWSLSGNNGTILWSVRLGEPHLSTPRAQFYADRLVFMVGNTFMEISEGDGVIRKEMVLKVPVATTAARSEDRIFVGSTDDKFYCLRYQDGITLWNNHCQGEPSGSVSIAGEKVYFVTQENRLFVSALKKRRLVWDFAANGAMPGVVVDGAECFVPSKDTTLYCLESDSGRVRWKYLSGGSLRELPTVTADAVYQPVFQKSLLCLNRERDPNDVDGSPLRWEVDKGQCFLSQHGQQTYVMTHAHELTVVDSDSGARQVGFFVPAMDFFAQNNEHGAIYMASEGGVIVAIKPVGEQIGSGRISEEALEAEEVTSAREAEEEGGAGQGVRAEQSGL